MTEPYRVGPRIKKLRGLLAKLDPASTERAVTPAPPFAAPSQGECHDAALREYRRICPDAPADQLAASGQVNRMVAAAIKLTRGGFGTGRMFEAPAGLRYPSDKERPTSWRERGPRLWDLSPEHALSNVRNHHSRRPRGSRVSIFGDPGVGRRKDPPSPAGRPRLMAGHRGRRPRVSYCKKTGPSRLPGPGGVGCR